jgi:hypothetical protein
MDTFVVSKHLAVHLEGIRIGSGRVDRSQIVREKERERERDREREKVKLCQ